MDRVWLPVHTQHHGQGPAEHTQPHGQRLALSRGHSQRSKGHGQYVGIRFTDLHLFSPLHKHQGSSNQRQGRGEKVGKREREEIPSRYYCPSLYIDYITCSPATRVWVKWLSSLTPLDSHIFAPVFEISCSNSRQVITAYPHVTLPTHADNFTFIQHAASAIFVQIASKSQHRPHHSSFQLALFWRPR